MGMEAAIRRRENMFSSLLQTSPGRRLGAMGLVHFGALFSDIYGEENNCMSGIAMFMVRTCKELDSAAG
jgi:hypothetical protein